MSTVAEEYKIARSVLLDALGAIGDHREAAILVGAQAVYVHTGAGSLTLALMTTDADLALRASVLEDDPDLAAALMAADFSPGNQPGSWLGRGDVAVDLMVAPHESNVERPSARAAKLPGHARSVARITPGLEPALVDHSPRTIRALGGDDPRSFELNVAGPAALVVAKLVKLSERYEAAQAGSRDRVRAKDALDVLRLLQEVEPADFRAGFEKHADDEYARDVSGQALQFLRQHGVDPSRFLPQLAATEMLGEPWVTVSFAALSAELVETAGELFSVS